ncbi:MAG: hypothetical protein IPH18_00545 [Chitinophagaceae bacterium]|nr:hypothetical protein [Chitinophagaceae bacterium]
MATSVADKLRIKAGFTLLTINAPADYKKELGALPSGTKITNAGKIYNQIHWFVQNKEQMEKQLSKVMKLVLRQAQDDKPEVTVWVYYPKGTSGVQTDLTRDKGLESLLAEGDKLTWISLISFNNTWSVFGFRAKTEADKRKEAQPKAEREIFKWVNPKPKR